MDKERFCSKCGITMGFIKRFCYVCFDCKLKQKKECDRKYRDRMGEKLKERKRQAYYGLNTKNPKSLSCKQCNTKILMARCCTRNFCSRQCFFESQKTARLGENNPAYRNGLSTKKSVSWKTYNTKHLRSCAKYRKDFMERNDYIHCEYCKVNNSIKFEVHHIIFASEKPRHEHLHDFRNLIMVCIECHNNFHKAGGMELRKSLIENRGLVELFGKDIL